MTPGHSPLEDTYKKKLKRLSYIKYHLLTSQPVNLSLVNQTRPDQDFNLPDLILELAFLFKKVFKNSS